MTSIYDDIIEGETEIIRYTIKTVDGSIVQSGFFDHAIFRDRRGFGMLVGWAYERGYTVTTWPE